MTQKCEKNVNKLKAEINDLYGVIRWLESYELWNGNVKDDDLIIAKINKLDKMMEISRNMGTLK